MIGGGVGGGVGLGVGAGGDAAAPGDDDAIGTGSLGEARGDAAGDAAALGAGDGVGVCACAIAADAIAHAKATHATRRAIFKGVLSDDGRLLADDRGSQQRLIAKARK